jgi:diacylglycerol kinase (ATP)
MTRVGVVAHEGKSLGGGLEELRSVLAESGFADPPWYVVRKSRDAPKQVRRVLSDGVDRLLVWGGDGTVRRCVDTVLAQDAQVEVGILPAGTANLLAHALGVPIDLREALDVALHGLLRRIDVGVINGEAFCVMAGTGFDALMIRDAETGMKDRFGRLAYIRTGVRNLDASGPDVTITVDDEQWFEGTAACVLVGNTGRILGGIDAFPNARCDDGVLDVGVLTAQSRLDWLRVGVRAVTGRIDSSPMVAIRQGRSIKVRLDRKMPWELDGGDRPPTKRLDVSLLPARVPVCVPAP